MLFNRYLYFTAVLLSACSGVGINRSTAGSGSVNILTSNLAASSNVELSGQTLRLSKDSPATTTVGCTLAGSDAATTATTPNWDFVISSPGYLHANLFQFNNYLDISSAQIYVLRTGNPGGTGNMMAELRTATASNPAADPSAVLATSASVAVEPTSDELPGTMVTFPFSSNLELTKNTVASLVLRVGMGTAVDSVNNIAWTHAAGAGCTSFPTSKRSLNNGATWLPVAAASPGFFTLTVSKHKQSGTAEWVLLGKEGAVWQLSTFNMGEDPRALGSGTITYDIGVGTNASPVNYTYSGLTEIAIQSATGVPATLTGKYLYLRANFSVPSPGIDQAELNGGTVSYQ